MCVSPPGSVGALHPLFQADLYSFHHDWTSVPGSWSRLQTEICVSTRRFGDHVHHLICSFFLVWHNPIMVCANKAANLVADFEAILDVNAHLSFFFPMLLNIPAILWLPWVRSLGPPRFLLWCISWRETCSQHFRRWPRSQDQPLSEQNFHLSDHINYLRAINALAPERHWNHWQLKIGTSFLVTLTTGCLNSLSWSGTLHGLNADSRTTVMHPFWISPSSSPSAQHCPLSSSPSTGDPQVDHLDLNRNAFLHVLRRTLELINDNPVHAHCPPTTWPSLLWCLAWANLTTFPASSDVSCVIILSSTSSPLLSPWHWVLSFPLFVRFSSESTRFCSCTPSLASPLLHITWCHLITSSEWLVSSILRFLTTLKRFPINCSLPAWTFRHIHVAHLGLASCRTLPRLLDQLNEHPAGLILLRFWSTSRTYTTQLYGVSHRTSVSCSRSPSASAPMRPSLSRLQHQSRSLSRSRSATFRFLSTWPRSPPLSRLQRAVCLAHPCFQDCVSVGLLTVHEDRLHFMQRLGNFFVCLLHNVCRSDSNAW